jgi:hypothetical protein
MDTLWIVPSILISWEPIFGRSLSVQQAPI